MSQLHTKHSMLQLHSGQRKDAVHIKISSLEKNLIAQIFLKAGPTEPSAKCFCPCSSGSSWGMERDVPSVPRGARGHTDGGTSEPEPPTRVGEKSHREKTPRAEEDRTASTLPFLWYVPHNLGKGNSKKLGVLERLFLRKGSVC